MKSPVTKVIPICFTLPVGLIARLDAAAEADDRSRSSVVRQVLSQALADDAALRENAAARFRALMSPTSPGAIQKSPDDAVAVAPADSINDNENHTEGNRT